MGKECSNCAEKFQTKSSGKKFCSPACRSSGATLHKLSCFECGNTFESKRKWTKCCSDTCVKVRSKRYHANRRSENSEELSRYAKSYYENVIKKDEVTLIRRLNYSREYYVENKERISTYNKDRYRDNRDDILARNKRYNSTDKGKVTKSTSQSKRRCAKLNATPRWADMEKIALIYEKAKWLESLTGLKYHVDHIVPLVSNKVCGLHVHANLQILEAGINMKKSNKLTRSK